MASRSTVTLTTRVSGRLAAQFEAAARAQGRTKNRQLQLLIQEWVKANQLANKPGFLD